ncbi:ABC transporter ATP-binding protein [Arcicella aquatica]|uniref:ABC transporter ATP-binding protein n=1 Tax=Arcicella aquatica TaxID=217141 RepID=A0ABU5QUX1_9BACT|nr:ABC transporter ATP-binding protein [Arcicella aquatica]MEA5260464.1 ABC transporter ATP-binding protein [Arcicella aquatica]
MKTYITGNTEVRALNDVSLTIDKGEFLAIMGASGSGKSTFMNILGCLDNPTSGTYLMEGIDVLGRNRDELAELRNQKLGFVFQSFNILPRTSALENVELPLLYNSKIAIKDYGDRAMNALKSVGLGDRVNAMPNELSGGQQQRVAIARALVNDPVIIMADEPTGNLDSRTSYEIMQIFQALNDKGITVVMVTHEPDIAQFAKTNVIFKDGKIIFNDTVETRKIATEELKKIALLTDEKSTT